MKGLIVVLLLIIAGGVSYLAVNESRKKQEAEDLANEIATRALQSRVMEGITFSVEARWAVRDYYEANGVFPESFSDVGIETFRLNRPESVLNMKLEDDGVIVVNYVPSRLGLYLMDVTALYWVPKPNDKGGIDWSCVPSEEFGVIAKEKEIIPEPCYPSKDR
ncbi:MAG: pilin [Woeseiaceae bacterium]|nr:pilin [Woeseiaceae bacterium]